MVIEMGRVVLVGRWVVVPVRGWFWLTARYRKNPKRQPKRDAKSGNNKNASKGGT